MTAAFGLVLSEHWPISARPRSNDAAGRNVTLLPECYIIECYKDWRLGAWKRSSR